MIVLLLLCVTFSPFGVSFPLPSNDQQAPYTNWVSEPARRGSFRLIVNCLITLTLCVWTAVHLNITVEHPNRRKLNWLKRLRNTYGCRRVGWVLMGLLAPELVVYTAWRQWSSARELTRLMKDAFEKSTFEGIKYKHEWTIVHSFYAGMGGFVVDVLPMDDESVSFIPGHSEVTLTAQGVLCLALSGYQLPDISKESILDRSKADNLAKVLVCLQAGYMIIQCTSRLASHLPLSFLELNTLGHVICALIMYIFWLSKPQDIHVPTRITDKGLSPILAYMYMVSSMSKSFDGLPREWTRLKYYPERTTAEAGTELLNSTAQGLDVWVNKAGRDVGSSSEDRYGFNYDIRLEGQRKPWGALAEIGQDETLANTGIGPQGPLSFRPSRRQQADLRRTNASYRNAALAKYPLVYRPVQVFVDESMARRWQLASEFLASAKRKKDNPTTLLGMWERNNALIERRIQKSTTAAGVSEVSSTSEKDSLIEDSDDLTSHLFPTVAAPEERELVVHEVPNWGTSAGLIHKSFYFTWGAISLAVGLYGGLHLEAWNSHFPTPAEKLAWRCSAILVAASGSLALLLIMIDRLPSWGKESYIRWWMGAINGRGAVQGGGMWWWLTLQVVVAGFVILVLMVPLAIGVLAYVPARMFLVVEAFISLRNAPVAIYETPEWTELIPHL